MESDWRIAPLERGHDRARAFYVRYEFESLPDRLLTLLLPLAAVRKLFLPA